MIIKARYEGPEQLNADEMCCVSCPGEEHTVGKHGNSTPVPLSLLCPGELGVGAHSPVLHNSALDWNNLQNELSSENTLWFTPLYRPRVFCHVYRVADSVLLLLKSEMSD